MSQTDTNTDTTVDFEKLGEARRWLERIGKQESAEEVAKSAARIIQLEQALKECE